MGAGVNRNGVIVDLAAVRACRAALRRLKEEPVPEKLVDDVLGPDARHFEIAERLSRATGLRWAAPGSVRRAMRDPRRR